MKVAKKHNKKATAIIIAALTLTTIILLWSLYVGISNWHPPQYFPLNDPQGEYTVIKTNEHYSLIYKTKADNIKTILCDTNMIGLKTNCRIKTIKEFIIDIANSPVSLDEFVNEKVLVTGNFIYTNKQCIQKNCKTSAEYAGLNIKKITKMN